MYSIQVKKARILCNLNTAESSQIVPVSNFFKLRTFPNSSKSIVTFFSFGKRND